MTNKNVKLTDDQITIIICSAFGSKSPSKLRSLVSDEKLRSALQTACWYGAHYDEINAMINNTNQATDNTNIELI